MSLSYLFVTFKSVKTGKKREKLEHFIFFPICGTHSAYVCYVGAISGAKLSRAVTNLSRAILSPGSPLGQLDQASRLSKMGKGMWGEIGGWLRVISGQRSDVLF